MAEAITGLRYQYIGIFSLDNKKKLDLTNSVTSIDYFEDILEPNITMTMSVTNTNGIVSGLPIRGGEQVIMEIETASGTFTLDGKNSMYVYKVSGLDAQRMSESFTLHLASRENFANETVRCLKKYNNLTIDKHVKDILTNTLRTSKIGIIEPTSNSYSFIGNNKKPFHILQWLGPKSVSKITKSSGVSGSGKDGTANGTAGFLFYENKSGFNFRSIDSLVSNTQLQSSSSNKEVIYRYYYGGMVIESNNPANNFKIINYFMDQNIDLRKSLRVGMYANKTYFYDTKTNEVSIYSYKLKDEIKKSTKLGTQESIVVASELSDSYSRVLVRTSDHGVLGSSGQLETSGRDNADSAKSFSRYNLLFTQALNILIPCNTKLKVGDIIYCEFLKMESGNSKEVDDQTSGNYLIKELRHHFSNSQNTTSLRLIRDSYGLYGKNQ